MERSSSVTLSWLKNKSSNEEPYRVYFYPFFKIVKTEWKNIAFFYSFSSFTNMKKTKNKIKKKRGGGGELWSLSVIFQSRKQVCHPWTKNTKFPSHYIKHWGLTLLRSLYHNLSFTPLVGYSSNHYGETVFQSDIIDWIIGVTYWVMLPMSHIASWFFSNHDKWMEIPLRTFGEIILMIVSGRL